jgi:hypothetical protein
MADPKEGKATLPVRLHMDVIELARIVTGYTGETMTDLLSDTLRPILERMEQEQVEKRRKAREQAARDSADVRRSAEAQSVFHDPPKKGRRKGSD